MRNQVPDGMSRLRTDGDEVTHLDDDVPVCNVQNLQVTADAIPFSYVCTDAMSRMT